MWGILYKFYFRWSHITKFWKAYFGPWGFSFKWRISLFQCSQHVMLLSFFSLFSCHEQLQHLFFLDKSKSFQKVRFLFLDSFLTNGSVATKAINWLFMPYSCTKDITSSLLWCGDFGRCCLILLLALPRAWDVLKILIGAEISLVFFSFLYLFTATLFDPVFFKLAFGHLRSKEQKKVVITWKAVET